MGKQRDLVGRKRRTQAEIKSYMQKQQRGQRQLIFPPISASLHPSGNVPSKNPRSLHPPPPTPPPPPSASQSTSVPFTRASGKNKSAPIVLDDSRCGLGLFNSRQSKYVAHIVHAEVPPDLESNPISITGWTVAVRDKTSDISFRWRVGTVCGASTVDARAVSIKFDSLSSSSFFYRAKTTATARITLIAAKRRGFVLKNAALMRHLAGPCTLLVASEWG